MKVYIVSVLADTADEILPDVVNGKVYQSLNKAMDVFTETVEHYADYCENDCLFWYDGYETDRWWHAHDDDGHSIDVMVEELTMEFEQDFHDRLDANIESSNSIRDCMPKEDVYCAIKCAQEYLEELKKDLS